MDFLFIEKPNASVEVIVDEETVLQEGWDVTISYSQNNNMVRNIIIMIISLCVFV